MQQFCPSKFNLLVLLSSRIIKMGDKQNVEGLLGWRSLKKFNSKKPVIQPYQTNVYLYRQNFAELIFEFDFTTQVCTYFHSRYTQSYDKNMYICENFHLSFEVFCKIFVGKLMKEKFKYFVAACFLLKNQDENISRSQ